jgi:hypothetical protein
MSDLHDNKMPKGWHQIKCCLLTEIKTAKNFHLCIEATEALFHARLIGEQIAKECNSGPAECSGIIPAMKEEPE